MDSFTDPPKHRSAGAIPYINMTPMIDVLLVLLIIFMVLSPLKPTKFEASVPQEPPEQKQEIRPNPLTLVVGIDREGNLRLNAEEEIIGTVNQAGALGQRLRATFDERLRNRAYRENIETLPNFASMSEEERIEKRVFIKAPRSIKYEEVVKVIDVVKGAGASPVGLQIDDLQQ
ncbi:MAG: biopolymer transporter ExbD [Pyrinomonadaceae bacterium MAG19_C2-C3]|nr:biopolymer transporter ExbD [Pyrinomonadaceae bacterium MAG19_C2-C3]